MNRRHFLRLAASGSTVLLALPYISFAAADTGKRLVFIIQRGAADGLNTVIPYADPGYARLRGALAIDASQATKLDSLFALHPALTETAKIYSEKQALFVHAVASPYRDRSHFDGQNILETGGIAPYQIKDGWMNRLLTLLPLAQNNAIALASSVPMALRGKIEVHSYAPSGLPQAPDDLLIRVGQLYAGDSQLDPVWMAAMDAHSRAEDVSTKQDPANLGKLAASFLARADGPRIAMIETGGWDTHTGQEGRLARQLKSLDGLIAALRNNLGSVWQDTTVVVATEFGRTAAANGTGGTDHGTASAAMILGGNVAGGRVITDWPGLGRADLYENRDLKPTQNLNTLLAAIASTNFHLDPVLVTRTLFPEMPVTRLPEGLIKSGA